MLALICFEYANLNTYYTTTPTRMRLEKDIHKIPNNVNLSLKTNMITKSL